MEHLNLLNQTDKPISVCDIELKLGSIVNPLLKMSNPGEDLSQIKNHMLINGPNPFDVTDFKKGVKSKLVEKPAVLHIFVKKGRCYDKAGYISPGNDQIRMIVGPKLFDDYNSYWFRVIMTLILNGACPVVDISCCSWIDQNHLSLNLRHFLEFVLKRGGTVRFCDFALREGIVFIREIGLNLDITLCPTLKGEITLNFDPEVVASTGLADLQLLSDLAVNGEFKIHAMISTRKMALTNRLPVGVQQLIQLSTGEPAMLLIKLPNYLGQIILFSCHFAEINSIRGVDPERVASRIRLTRGQEAANQFLDEVNQTIAYGDQAGLNRTVSVAVSEIMSATSPFMSCSPLLPTV